MNDMFCFQCEQTAGGKGCKGGVFSRRHAPLRPVLSGLAHACLLVRSAPVMPNKALIDPKRRQIHGTEDRSPASHRNSVNMAAVADCHAVVIALQQ